MIFLYLAPPLVTIIYAYLEQKGYLDLVTKRKFALDGLKRLKSTQGYPHSFLYDDQLDKKEFSSLLMRISKNTESEEIKSLSEKNVLPSCIVVGGKPVNIEDVPLEWPQNLRFSYLPEHSILFLYGIKRNVDQSKGKAIRACTLSQLDRWLAEEKENRKYLFGTIMLGFFGLLIIALRIEFFG